MHDRFTAAFGELGDTDLFFDTTLVEDAQLFFDLVLDWQAVRIPTCFSRHVIIASFDILDRYL